MTFEKQFSKLFHAFSSWLLLKIWSRIFSVMFQTNMFWQPQSWALCIALLFPVCCGLECNTQLMRCTKVGGLVRSRQYKDPRYKEHFTGVQQGGCQFLGPLLWKEFAGRRWRSCLCFFEFCECAGGGWFLGVVKGWVMKWTFCASLGSNFSHLRDGQQLRIHQCDILLYIIACGLGSWEMRCLLYHFCSRDFCTLGNVCGKVNAI